MRRVMAKRKAFVGIGTLVVFIATILTAAIAAGVIIRTSGVLQERAYAVAGEARKRIVTGMEVTEVYGNSNQSAATIPQLEISVRLRPGARELNLRQLGMTVTTDEDSFSATLQHTTVAKYQDLSFAGNNFTNGTWVDLSTIDTDLDLNQDSVDDYMRLFTNDTTSYLQFNISSVGVINVSLGTDLSNITGGEANVSLSNERIEFDYDIYGYITANLNVTENNTLSENVDDGTFTISQFPSSNVCTFDNLIPERFFCYTVKLGDTDTVLEPGESMILHYKFKDADALREDMVFQIAFVPKSGAITYLFGQAPSTIRKSKILVWPE